MQKAMIVARTTNIRAVAANPVLMAIEPFPVHPQKSDIENTLIQIVTSKMADVFIIAIYGRKDFSICCWLNVMLTVLIEY